jgi:hypothetical protein
MMHSGSSGEGLVGGGDSQLVYLRGIVAPGARLSLLSQRTKREARDSGSF